MSEELTQSPKQQLENIKTRLDQMGVKYHPSIGLEKATEKLTEALSGEPADKEQDAPVAEQAETEGQMRKRLRKEAEKLVRVNITCMNPLKREWDGEVFTVGNSMVGTHSKFVKFGTSDGYHIPHIIYEQIRDRQCQVFHTVIGPRGRKTRNGKLIKEFAIDILPPLSKAELSELAQMQAMSGSIDKE
jgi:hypothetical protein